jgi:hypothetical protein
MCALGKNGRRFLKKERTRFASGQRRERVSRARQVLLEAGGSADVEDARRVYSQVARQARLHPLGNGGLTKLQPVPASSPEQSNVPASGTGTHDGGGQLVGR